MNGKYLRGMGTMLHVIAVLFDLNKAFNRVSHSHVIQDLYDMHALAGP